MAEQAAEVSRVYPMTEFDLGCVLTWRNHPDVRRYMCSQNEITLDEHQRWFVRTLQDPRKNLLIFEVGNEPLGFVNFSELACGGVADWGFYAAPAAPKGTGRRLGLTALDHAFNQLNLHKICGQVIGDNDRSIRLHRSLGFQQEGILRNQHYDGERFHDVICFGLLSHEWPPKP